MRSTPGCVARNGTLIEHATHAPAHSLWRGDFRRIRVNNTSGIWRTTGWRGSFRGVRFIGLVVMFHGWEQGFRDEVQH